MLAANDLEYIVFHMPARSIRGVQAASGRMRITTRRILFEPAREADAEAAMDVELARVERAVRCCTYLIVPNGVKLSLAGGETRVFAVRNRTRVIRFIRARMAGNVDV